MAAQGGGRTGDADLSTWQTDARRRSAGTQPRESCIEVSVGRELAFGLALDVGWWRSRLVRDEGALGTTDAALTPLSWRAEF